MSQDPILAKLDQILTAHMDRCPCGADPIAETNLRALLAEVAIEYAEEFGGSSPVPVTQEDRSEIQKRFGVPSEGEKT
jgi:hypothetical protein